MCSSPKFEQATPAAAPAPPIKTAENFRMQERRKSSGGKVTKNTARSRRTMRTDVKMTGGAGANIARMG